MITGDKAFLRGSQRGVPGCFGSYKYPCAQWGGEGVRRERKVTPRPKLLGFEQKACDVIGSFTELMSDIEDWK